MAEFSKGGEWRDGTHQTWNPQKKILEITERRTLPDEVRDVLIRTYGGKVSIIGTDGVKPRFETTLSVKGDTKEDAHESLSTKRGQFHVTVAETAYLFDASSEVDTDERVIDPEERGALPPHELVPDTGIRRKMSFFVPEEDHGVRYDLQTNVADTTLTNLKSPNLTISSTFGNVGMAEVVGKRIDIKTFGGTTSGENVSGEKVQVSSIGGGVHIEGFTGTADFETGTGKIVVTDGTFLGAENKLTSATGQVEVTVKNRSLDIRATGPLGRMLFPDGDDFTEIARADASSQGSEPMVTIWGRLGPDFYHSEALDIYSGEGVTVNKSEPTEPTKNS